MLEYHSVGCQSNECSPAQGQHSLPETVNASHNIDYVVYRKIAILYIRLQCFKF